MMFSPMNMILLAAADAPAVAAPAMPNAEAALSFFSGWTWMHWLALALCVLVLLFVLYLICNMIVRRIRLRRMVNTMREDLLLRRELADMAGGKDIKAQRQEQYLRTESIRMDVQTSVARMRENGVDPQHTGCWLLLGEPGAGKSRLMQFGGIEFPAGINDMTDEGEATSTFKLWLCAKGAVWDIGGRMLLNRWGGKQDNEWRVFLEEFRKAYGNGLPNGVVLTIPADALLQDDSALRARKISMLAEELREGIDRGRGVEEEDVALGDELQGLSGYGLLGRLVGDHAVLVVAGSGFGRRCVREDDSAADALDRVSAFEFGDVAVDRGRGHPELPHQFVEGAAPALLQVLQDVVGP